MYDSYILFPPVFPEGLLLLHHIAKAHTLPETPVAFHNDTLQEESLRCKKTTFHNRKICFFPYLQKLPVKSLQRLLAVISTCSSSIQQESPRESLTP